jgi:hypothetical protein
MGLMAKLFGSAVGSTVKDVSEGLGGLATSLRSALTGELPPKVRGEIEKVIVATESLAMKTQGELTKIEAQSKSLFISGWRPSIGWICSIGLAFHFIIFPFLEWATPLDAPEIEAGALISLVLALLGIGGMRSYEKSKGVHDKH